MLAFCVAHGLESTFWQASLGVDLEHPGAHVLAYSHHLGRLVDKLFGELVEPGLWQPTMTSMTRNQPALMNRIDIAHL